MTTPGSDPRSVWYHSGSSLLCHLLRAISGEWRHRMQSGRHTLHWYKWKEEGGGTWGWWLDRPVEGASEGGQFWGLPGKFSPGLHLGVKQEEPGMLGWPNEEGSVLVGSGGDRGQRRQWGPGNRGRRSDLARLRAHLGHVVSEVTLTFLWWCL